VYFGLVHKNFVIGFMQISQIALEACGEVKTPHFPGGLVTGYHFANYRKKSKAQADCKSLRLISIVFKEIRAHS